MGRVNLAVDDALSQRLAELAKKQNKTMYAITNEALETYLELSKLGKNREEVFKILQLFEVIGFISAVPVPETLLDRLLVLAVKCSKEETFKLWREQGEVVGQVIKAIAPTLKELASFSKELEKFLPPELVELKINEEEGELEILLTGTGYSYEAAMCTAEGIKGFLKVYNCEVDEEQISSGFVKLHATIKT
jgi:hypothetical protein